MNASASIAPAQLHGYSVERQRLVSTMAALRFGTIEQLYVREKEPVFNPAPRITRAVKFGSDRGDPYQPPSADNELKSQIRELFQLFDQIGDGLIVSLEVRHGLPFRAVVAYPHDKSEAI